MLEKLIENFLMKSRIEKQTIGEHVLTGRCKDYAAYMKKVGEIQGTEKSENRIRDLYKAMVDREDFDNYREISNGSESESD